MLKTFAFTLLATLAVIGASIPAQAAPYCAEESGYVHDNASAIAQQLKERGVNVSGVEEWNGCVRAYVTNADGSSGMAFYDPMTLRPIGSDTARI